MHSQNGALRRIEDRRRQQRAKHAAIGDGERAALQIVDADLAVAGLDGQVGDGFLDRGEAQVLARRTTGTMRPRSVLTATPM